MSLDKITKGDELTQSLDIVNDNIARLKELFPEVLTEGKIDFKVLQDILGKEIEDEEEYYRFTWAGKAQARREAHKPSTGTLRPAKDESVNWDTTENLYIEGDNLEVLKLLQKSYNNKVKMIYIDPPYNTGKDFVYKDNYKDNLKNYQQISGQIDDEGNKLTTNTESDGHYHSNWLNMMYPRLRLARNLLSEEGVMFLSIDENELINLEKICHEIFGESNTIGNFPVVMNLKGNQDAYGFAETHEYIIVCTKNKEKCEIGEFPIDEETIFREWKTDEYGLYKEADNLRATGVNAPREKRPNLWYPIFLNKDKNEIYVTESNEPLSNEDIVVYPINPEGEELSWYWGKDTFNLSKHNLIIKETNNGWQFYRKQRPKLGDYPTKKPKSFLYKSDYSTSTATTKLKDLMGKKVFESPKPVPFLKDLLLLASDKDSIIVDFFSGSGSTAQSTFELNRTDGGQRKFIMVQLPEEIDAKSEAYKSGYRYITDIAKERIKRSAKLIVSETPEASKKLDLGFKVFKLDSSNIKGWDGNPDNLVDSLFDSQDNIKTGRTEEDVLFEILLKYGLDLTLPIEEKIIEGKKVFSVGFGALFICLADDITNKVAEGIGAWKEALNPEVCRVIFKDSGFGDVEKTNSVQTLKRFGINEIKSI